jgi:hypothetical protein
MPYQAELAMAVGAMIFRVPPHYFFFFTKARKTRGHHRKSPNLGQAIRSIGIFWTKLSFFGQSESATESPLRRAPCHLARVYSLKARPPREKPGRRGPGLNVASEPLHSTTSCREEFERRNSPRSYRLRVRSPLSAGVRRLYDARRSSGARYG